MNYYDTEILYVTNFNAKDWVDGTKLYADITLKWNIKSYISPTSDEVRLLFIIFGILFILIDYWLLFLLYSLSQIEN